MGKHRNLSNEQFRGNRGVTASGRVRPVPPGPDPWNLAGPAAILALSAGIVLGANALFPNEETSTKPTVSSDSYYDSHYDTE